MRRYQTADEVLKDLNQSPVVATPAPTAKNPIPSTPTSTPTFVSKSSSQIDLELEEMKSQFLGGGKPQASPAQPPKPISPPQNKSVDEELEEMKAKYLGNNNL